METNPSPARGMNSLKVKEYLLRIQEYSFTINIRQRTIHNQHLMNQNCVIIIQILNVVGCGGTWLQSQLIVRMRQEDHLSARVLDYYEICQLGVCTKFSIIMVISKEEGTIRLPKERSAGQGCRADGGQFPEKGLPKWYHCTLRLPPHTMLRTVSHATGVV